MRTLTSALLALMLLGIVGQASAQVVTDLDEAYRDTSDAQQFFNQQERNQF